MINKENRNQLDRIAAIVGGDFGIADLNGTVLYSGSCNIAEGISLFTPGEEGGDETPGEEKSKSSFSLCSNYYTMRSEIDGNLPVRFFLSADGENEDSAKRLLELAICAYDNRSDARERRMNDFLRVLLTEGFSALKADDVSTYTDILKADTPCTAIIVSRSTGDEETDSAVIGEFLSGIFPSQEGFYTVTLNAERICVICPVTEENTYDMLLETASLIKDTVLSELMVSVTVSVGMVVPGLKKIHFAYDAANSAEVIGRMFELGGKCFVYDKLGLARLIYDLPEKKCRAFLSETLGPQFFPEDRFAKNSGNSDELLKTVKTFLATNQNISETSRALYIHRNTLVYRLDKFNKMTGLDCTKFEDGMRIGIALLVMQYLSGVQETRDKTRDSGLGGTRALREQSTEAGGQ